ncbi:MAG: thiolase domain-containing protein [Candidatus Binatia bacterium]
MREIAVISFAQAHSVRRDIIHNEVEILMPVVAEAVSASGLTRDRIGFTVSGSCDYLAGAPFSFVMALDGVGAWPPIEESHVEMDGAWALAEAWTRLQHGDLDTALVFGFGKSSVGELPDVLTLQLDPYLVAPLWPDSISVAALQARAMLDAGLCTEEDMAEVAVRSRRDAKSNPFAQLAGDFSVDELLKQPCISSPLRRHDCAPISDGASAVILAAGDVARALCEKTGRTPAWIRGLDHRVDAQNLGGRDLTTCPSARLASEKAGAFGTPIDVAEIYAPFTHQEILLRRELGLGASTKINPSGGVLAANPMMAAGLIRIGEAASRIHRGEARRVLAHATSGPCLQQNLVCVLEGE